nr:hypothetical protein [Tanacetum cinerariifolium]
MVVSLPFTVNLDHDGVFDVNPLELVLVSLTSMYYKIPGDPFTTLKLLKIDESLCEFVKACYENNLKIDLFTEHNGYDIMEMIHEDLHSKIHVSHINSDSDGETNVRLDDVAHTNNPNPNLQGRFLLEVEDPDDEQVKSKFKAKHDVSYPSFNHGTPWNECKPMLGMRDVSQGRCVGLKGKKPKKINDDECETNKQGSKIGLWDDLNMRDREGINIISYGHKACYPMLSTNSVRHIYATFKKR